MTQGNRSKTTNRMNRGERSKQTTAEIRRFNAWLEERRISTAPVITWPPDQVDFFGGRSSHPKDRKG